MATVTIPDIAVIQEIAVGGTPTTGPFAFTFSFFEDDDLLVYVDSVLQSSALYTVTGNAGTEGGFEGGEIDFLANISSVTLTIERNVARERTENFPNTGGLSIPALNKAFNKVTAWVQELYRLIGGKIGFASSVTDPPGELTQNASERSNTILGFDGSGDLVLLVPADLSLSTVTAYINTLLDDPDAATAQQTLELEPGVDVQAFSSNILFNNVTDTLTVGHTLQAYDHNTMGATHTMDLTLGQQQRGLVSADVTLNPSSASHGGFVELALTNSGAGHTVTFPGTWETTIAGTMSESDAAVNLIRMTRIQLVDDTYHDAVEIVNL